MAGASFIEAHGSIVTAGWNISCKWPVETRLVATAATVGAGRGVLGRDGPEVARPALKLFLWGATSDTLITGVTAGRGAVTVGLEKLLTQFGRL